MSCLQGANWIPTGTLNSEILVVTVEDGVLLESSRWRPGMLLKHPTSLHPHTELSSHNVKGAEVEKLCPPTKFVPGNVF